MNSNGSKFLLVGFVLLVVLFLFFGGWGVQGGMMRGGVNGSSWIWVPTLITLFLGVALGWAVFKK
jgi:F0F1-type ATP synthase assembly protein I